MSARPPRVDLDEMRHSLCQAGAFVAPSWLAAARRDPAGFWRSVGPHLVTAASGAARSSLFERYQLAHDLGARHASGRGVGFVHGDASGWTATSYARLAEAARALAGDWRARGVAPGTCVAIVAPLAVELVTALLAAWHLGAIAAPLPMWGRRYINDRRAALGAVFTATSRPCALWLEVADDHRLATVAVGGAEPGVPHPYAPGEPALRVCSPLGAAPLAPFDVGAERLYLGALRDGALFFGLGPERGLAAPGWCDVQFGLPLVLACLATGGHFIALGLDDACQRPELACDGRVHVLGVHPQLRDAILAHGGRGSGPARWFYNPAATHAPEAWQRLAAERPFARALTACYTASPVVGGAITWSAWRRTPAFNAALRAPGVAWRLIDPGRGGAAGDDDHGVLVTTDVSPDASPDAALAASADALGQPLLGRVGGESLWLASLGAHRDGQRLPAGELEAVAREHTTEVWAAALVDDLRAGAVLIVFVHPDRLTAGHERDALAGKLRDTIALELAPHLVPARIEVYALMPRFDAEGNVDAGWCRGQHASGRFAAKQREPVFATLSRLCHSLRS